MKNKNLIFIQSISNFISVIFSLLIFLLYILAFNSSKTINIIHDQYIALVSVPIVYTVIACAIILFFYYWLNKFFINQELYMNSKLKRIIFYTTLINAITITVKIALEITAILSLDKTAIIVMLSISLAISIIAFIVISFMSWYMKIGLEYLIDNKQQSVSKINKE